MLLLVYDLCSAASWLLCIKTYKSKRSQIYFTDKYLHAASYTNSTMKNGLKSFTFPRYHCSAENGTEKSTRYIHETYFIVMQQLLKSYHVIYQKKAETIFLLIMIKYVSFEYKY